MYIKFFYYINQCIKNKKNFSVRINKNNEIEIPKSGYIVSITPLINIDMNIHEIIKYITLTKNIEIDGKLYNLYLGGWFNKDKLYCDISIVTDSKEEAIQIGKHCNQEAIYNINKKEVIYI